MAALPGRGGLPGFWPLGRGAAGAGVIKNQNVVPLPTVLSTPKRKPCCWKMALVMDSPSPVPALPASERLR